MFETEEEEGPRGVLKVEVERGQLEMPVHSQVRKIKQEDETAREAPPETPAAGDEAAHRLPRACGTAVGRPRRRPFAALGRGDGEAFPSLSRLDQGPAFPSLSARSTALHIGRSVGGDSSSVSVRCDCDGDSSCCVLSVVHCKYMMLERFCCICLLSSVRQGCRTGDLRVRGGSKPMRSRGVNR